MPRRELQPDPVGRSRRPCACGMDIPATDSGLKYLGEWNVLHKEHHLRHLLAGPTVYAPAARKAVDLLKDELRQAQAQLGDRSDELAEAVDELAYCRDRIELLEAELDDLNRAGGS